MRTRRSSYNFYMAERKKYEVLGVSDFARRWGISLKEMPKGCVALIARGDFHYRRLDKNERDAAILKIPYIAVVGGREEESQKVALRTRSIEKQEVITIESLKNKILESIANKN